MEKLQYLENEKVKLSQSFNELLMLYGAPVILLLCILDLLVTPENFARFFIYRITATCIFVGLYLLVKRKRENKYQFAIVVLSALTVSIMVELMILSFGGHQSIYYAGMIIVFIFMFGFLPLFSVKKLMFLASLIYAIYLLPILFFDTIVNTRIFISNNMFLLASMSIGMIWRTYNDNLLVNKISLEYDLSQEKEQLKQYSTQLEEIVAQRTKDLAISEQKYRGLFDNASDGVAVYDSGGIIINVNRKFCDDHGFPADSLIGTNISVFDAGKDDTEKETRIKRIADGEPLIYEAKHVRRDGETLLFEISAKALDIDGHIYIQAFHRDISDKKRIQEQLFQSQKMDSIGMLAGGLAHDFNNVISAIIGHIELLGEHDNLDADARHRLAIIETSARRASKMISKLLKFARKGTIDILPVDLNSVVRDTYELISKTLSGKQAVVSLKLDETIPEIMGDANQIEQVIMNLMVNAGDAMPSGGLVTVNTYARELGSEASFIHPLLTPGPYVILTISDTGTGIPEHIRDKIFDPFFTTKEKGKGTGLGLAMVYGIVQDHRGVITVETHPGKGTTFNVYLPASIMGLADEPLMTYLGETAKGSVMVIDDNKEILSFVTDTVSSLGYQVKSTSNAILALQMFRENAADIVLVISDIFMPLIDGRDLIKNFKSHNPSIKVIAMSGYQIESFVRLDIPIDAFLRKPFGKIELIAAVHKLMQPSRSNHL